MFSPKSTGPSTQSNERKLIQFGAFQTFGSTTLSVNQLQSYFDTVIKPELEKAEAWKGSPLEENGLLIECSDLVTKYQALLQELILQAGQQQISLDQGFGQEYLQKDKSAFAGCLRAVMTALKVLKETLNDYYQTQFEWKWEEKLRRDLERQEKAARLQAEERAKAQQEEEQAKAQQEEAEEVNPVRDLYMESNFSGYASLDAFAKTALAIEKLLNPWAKDDRLQAVRSALQKMEGEIIGHLKLLTQALEKNMKYVPSLQACRLMNTMEYELINSYGSASLKEAAAAFERAWKNHKPIDISVKVLDERKEREQAQLGLICQEIVEIWNISPEKFMAEWGILKIGRHGTVKLSALATWPQKEGTFGELMLCKPMIVYMNKVAIDDQVVYEWEPGELVIQLLQGTTRRYKVLTLLECVITIHEVKDTLVARKEQGRITGDAWISLTRCVGGYILGGVSAKAKEQTRQINTLLSILNTKPNLICTGYEILASQASGSDIRADMVFRDSTQAQGIVIEIEGLPTSKKSTACTYLKERYAIKFKTLEIWLHDQNCQLILMVPAGTQIPADQQEQITKDKTMIIWMNQ